MIQFLTALLIIDILVLIILIIGLQQGADGGAGAAFGGGANTQGFFGASGGVSLIVKATWIAGALFFILALALVWLRANSKYSGLTDSEKAPAVPTAFVSTPAPEATSASLPLGTSVPAGSVSPSATESAAAASSASAAPGISPAPTK